MVIIVILQGLVMPHYERDRPVLASPIKLDVVWGRTNGGNSLASSLLFSSTDAMTNTGELLLLPSTTSTTTITTITTT